VSGVSRVDWLDQIQIRIEGDKRIDGLVRQAINRVGDPFGRSNVVITITADFISSVNTSDQSRGLIHREEIKGGKR